MRRAAPAALLMRRLYRRSAAATPISGLVYDDVRRCTGRTGVSRRFAWRTAMSPAPHRVLPLLTVCLLAACTAPPAAVPTVTPNGNAAAATATLPAAAAATVPAVPARPLPELDLAADLRALTAADIASTPTAAADGTQEPAIDDVAVLPLLWGGRDQLFVAYTSGMTVAGADQPHQVRLFSYNGDWQELAAATIESADLLAAGAVTQVVLDDQHLWLAVDSGVGAHGGCLDLLRWDGSRLTAEFSGCSESPDTAMFLDINNDGFSELLVNQTNHYVFCYACGVRDVRWQLLYWDGSGLREKPFAALGTADDAAATADAAHALAAAGRWKEADELLGTTNLSANLDAAWLAAVIRLNARLRLAEAEQSPYPLAANVLAGDFPAAAALVRSVSAAEAADGRGPLISGTVAEGNEATLWQLIGEQTAAALAVRPDDVDALLLHGWAGLMRDRSDEAAAAALARAAELSADDAFLDALITALQ
jgi:hypothetical protein